MGLLSVNLLWDCCFIEGILASPRPIVNCRLTIPHQQFPPSQRPVFLPVFCRALDNSPCPRYTHDRQDNRPGAPFSSCRRAGVPPGGLSGTGAQFSRFRSYFRKAVADMGAYNSSRRAGRSVVRPLSPVSPLATSTGPPRFLSGGLLATADRCRQTTEMSHLDASGFSCIWEVGKCFADSSLF